MKRKKVIVYITMAGFDSSCPVLAEERYNGFVAVPGHQLRVVAEDKSFINRDSLYYCYKTDYKRKCYDCFTFSQVGHSIEPSVSMSFVLRCQGYHPKTGSPGFSVDECIKAGVPAHKAKLYVNSETGLLHIKPMMLRAC